MNDVNGTYSFETDEHRERTFDSVERATFVSKTYTHLFLAIVAFVAVEFALFQTGAAEQLLALMGGNWLIVLGLFMVGSWLATRAAHSARSLPVQYAALAGFVGLEAVVFCPLLYVANNYYDGVLTTATFVTLVGFTALTAIVFMTRKDFSFLRGVLWWGGICAALLIVASLLFGFSLGPVFSVAMIAFAGAAILYDTSNVIHHYPEDRYVAAALELFGSVALLFWYVLRLVMSFSNR